MTWRDNLIKAFLDAPYYGNWNKLRSRWWVTIVDQKSDAPHALTWPTSVFSRRALFCASNPRIRSSHAFRAASISLTAFSLHSCGRVTRSSTENKLPHGVFFWVGTQPSQERDRATESTNRDYFREQRTSRTINYCGRAIKTNVRVVWPKCSKSMINYN